MRNTIPVLRLTLLAALAAPAAAAAQQAFATVHIEAGAAGRDNARADTLESRAAALYHNPRQWLEVARLHRRAARLRGDDPRAAASYRMSAWSYAAVRELDIAYQMMRYAAEAAARAGDVERSAGSYVDAAIISVAGDRPDRVGGLLEKTRVLLESPVMPPEARTAILRRIGDEPTLARTWARR